MDLPHRHRVAVERVVDLLVGINWALTGSVAHRLQGADVECGDLDIQTDEPQAYAAGEAMRGYVVEPVRFRRSVDMSSHFGRLRFDDVDVDLEVMGAIDKLSLTAPGRVLPIHRSMWSWSPWEIGVSLCCR